MFDVIHEDRQAECAELAAIDRAARAHCRKLAAHPSCSDPEHPGCFRCEPDDDDTPSIGDRREACAVIRDWLTEAESALMRGDLKKHFECLQEGLDVLTSLRGLEQ